MVLVHTALYYRVNRNIIRIAPFNVTSALLVILAGLADGPAVYVLWAAALAIQLLSPLIAHPGGRFDIQPAHFVERHGALIIVALGESVAARRHRRRPARGHRLAGWPGGRPRAGGDRRAVVGLLRQRR